MQPAVNKKNPISAPTCTRRILLVSSHRAKNFETNSNLEHFQEHPYSTFAIMYHLEKLGWATRYAGIRTSASLRKLTRCIDEFQPTIIYTYGSTVALNPLICRKLFCQWKNFHVIHGWDDVYGDIWGDFAGWPGRLLMNIMEYLIIKYSDRVVTLSYYLQNRGRRWDVECHYIPNGADIPQFDLAQSQVQLTGDFNLVYCGAQSRWKRTYEICEAMRHVPSNIKLYLTGKPYKYLQKYASDNCIFLGYLSKNDQLCVMAQADVFVSTANQDCNAKLQEYLRFKKPILGYDGIMNLFFKNGHTALLTKDYPAAIMQLYQQPELCQTLATNAAREIPLYNWMEIAQKFDHFLKQLL